MEAIRGILAGIDRCARYIRTAATMPVIPSAFAASNVDWTPTIRTEGTVWSQEQPISVGVIRCEFKTSSLPNSLLLHTAQLHLCTARVLEIDLANSAGLHTGYCFWSCSHSLPSFLTLPMVILFSIRDTAVPTDRSRPLIYILRLLFIQYAASSYCYQAPKDGPLQGRYRSLLP